MPPEQPGSLNLGLLEVLLSLKRRDEVMRSRLVAEKKLYGDYAEDMQRVHRENAERLNAIVEKHGWPGVTLVGKEGCRAAWLIAQHAICTPALQRKFLELLTRAVDSGDAPAVQAAYLSDRVRFHEQRPQRYGTVLDWNEAGELGCELDDAVLVDQRRKAVGLPPFEEALRRHRDQVREEGGGPPDDYRAYRKKARAWALRVGWL